MLPRKKVLLIRLSSLGDVVHCTSSIESWYAAGWEVSFLTKKNFSGVLAGNPHLTDLLVFDPKAAGSEAKAKEQLFCWVEAAGFDVILDLHDSWRTWMWRRQLRKTAQVFVLKKDRLREWFVLFFRMGARFGYSRGGRAKRVKAFSLKILSELNSKIALPDQPVTKLYLQGKGAGSLQFNLPLLPEKFLALLPGGAWSTKSWPHFAELANVALGSMPVVLLGAAKDVVCNDIANQCGNSSRIFNLRGKTSLQESMAILSKASWIVGNDTGFIHVAEALGKDVVVVEGPTHPYLGFSPYRQNSQVVGLDLFCRPCSKSGKFCVRWGSRKCLNGLAVSQVLAALKAQGFPC